MDKLHRGLVLTDHELRQLRLLLEDLEEHERGNQDEAAGFEPAVSTAQTNTLSGHATADGGWRLASRAGNESHAFYGSAQCFLVSSMGIGTYRGAMDNSTDAAYVASVHAALRGGINLIDTSLNYRQQRSERSVAKGLKAFIDTSGGSRDEFVVCTKGGYLVRGAITPGTLDSNDVVGGIHCISPAFLADQIDRSRQNLGLTTIDVYYLHNPEAQLTAISKAEFMKRMRAAFELLERAVASGVLQYYGTATWSGYRNGALSLRALVDLARAIGGERHHFRFVQLPFNLGMQEALTRPVEGSASLLQLAAELGVTVSASGALLQSRLARGLPTEMATLLPGLRSDAQRAIQFVRSTPGITSALVGMREVGHVVDNLAVSRIEPLTSVEYQRFRSAGF